ncbi:hypothetical protein EJ06DRAFT_83517 [Trichodelitschia bisporula]|uniref:Uncharacterized protein n=1 Tax=Trichodelitschia bisporula TaxID=703511 RepID=A0A6G1HRQ5_9PEZI|nr:hypothetical protein EJ06DRAFT_83517 [Trichodelitschia bisporula]
MLFTGWLDDHFYPEDPGRACAIMCIGFLYTKWLITPSKARYNDMPQWLRPRPVPLFVEHPLWVDYIPWPELREALVQSPDEAFAYGSTFFGSISPSPLTCLSTVTATIIQCSAIRWTMTLMRRCFGARTTRIWRRRSGRGANGRSISTGTSSSTFATSKTGCWGGVPQEVSPMDALGPKE